MNRTRHLLQSTILVVFLFGLNKVTGFVRLLLVGNAFGTGAEADAFAAANQLPELFFVLVAGGALAAAFIPVYTAYLKDQEKAKDAARLANTILTLVFLVLGGISLLAALFAPLIVSQLLVPRFSAEQQTLTANLMRIILLNTMLFGISGVISSILNSHQHFALPALAPIALDIGYFIGFFLLVPIIGVYGLAWGTVIGALFHIGIQVPGLIRYRIKLRPALAMQLVGVREIIWLMLPRIVMLGAIQAADLIIIRLASQEPGGAVSGYFYAYTLMQLPETLFGTAVAIVVFPTMSELFNASDRAGMKRLSMRSLRIIWLLTIPSAVALVLLGGPAVEFVLQRGAFDAASTAAVAAILVFFSVRVVSEASIEVLARMFYAQHNTWIPMCAYLGWFVVNAWLSYQLFGKLGVGGLALASTVAFTLLAVALLILNRWYAGPLGGRTLALAFGRNAVAAAGMAIVIHMISRIGLSTVPFLVVAGGASVITYFGINFLLGGRELVDLWHIARRSPQISAES
ncbi:MAG: murein biosynthesis integral membrane protein MurJ [Anaerolineae bacterium]|nr:murein biosynthesis integral membrane protein MurJ [Anaerolineae bacterium]